MQDTTSVDWPKILLLIDASVQAYGTLSKKHPPVAPDGYDIVETWSGVDSVFGHDRTVETYGIVLRSKTKPSRFVFAFRGTDSFEDAVDDLGIKKRHFKPFDSTTSIPKDLEVEAGFDDVYRESTGDVHSMQTQLFALLDKYTAGPDPLEELWITGHSLGAALCELFSLDVALSRPDICASNINFACPRVGNEHFVRFYTEQSAELDPARRTLRVQNVYDKVPCVPPELLGYQHVPHRFLVAFFTYGKDPNDPIDLIHNHSSANYQAVLQCAAEAGDEVCDCNKLEVKGESYAITSTKPNPHDVCTLW